MERLAAATPRSLYVHLPFCVRKCPYCAFSSSVPETGEIDQYLDAMDCECRFWSETFSGKHRFDTLYIGGGTPTILDVRQWELLFGILWRYFDFGASFEASVEANPGSLESGHLDLWRKNGITRVSIGVQSVHDRELSWLRRPHGGREAIDAVERTAQAGFRCSADIMFGIAGQTLRSFRESLDGVLAAGAEHISTYHLTIEPGTPWGTTPPADMTDGYPFYRFAQWYLPRKMMFQYEIASFARDGAECSHNMAYWDETDVLAVGASASGHLAGLRYTNVSEGREYIRRLEAGESPSDSIEDLPPEAKAREAAILALRTRRGIAFAEFGVRFGTKSLDRVLGILDSFPSFFFVRNSEYVALSPRGMRIANRIWEEIL
jgi:oxygen-independent coproporphyrinogen-3 oxidase